MPIYGGETLKGPQINIYGGDNLESPRMKIHGGEIKGNDVSECP